MFEYYQRFRDFTQKLMEIGGRHTVPCHNFEASSGLERTAGMPSSNPGVAYLGDAGRLSGCGIWFGYHFLLEWFLPRVYLRCNEWAGGWLCMVVPHLSGMLPTAITLRYQGSTWGDWRVGIRKWKPKKRLEPHGCKLVSSTLIKRTNAATKGHQLLRPVSPGPTCWQALMQHTSVFRSFKHLFE